MPDQRSTEEQLMDLYEIANLLKMYDAADYLKQVIKSCCDIIFEIANR